MGADNGHDIGTDGRLSRLETEHMILRRDLTALLAADRAIIERMREIAEMVGQALLKLDVVIARVDLIDEALAPKRRQ